MNNLHKGMLLVTAPALFIVIVVIMEYGFGAIAVLFAAIGVMVISIAAVCCVALGITMIEEYIKDRHL